MSIMIGLSGMDAGGLLSFSSYENLRNNPDVYLELSFLRLPCTVQI